jgi:hypothetical protein
MAAIEAIQSTIAAMGSCCSFGSIDVEASPSW